MEYKITMIIELVYYLPIYLRVIDMVYMEGNYQSLVGKFLYISLWNG